MTDKTFNENPFLKDTPVTPFSNATDAMVWQENNCSKCLNYESDSKSEDEAKCKMAFHLDLGYVVGEIPLWVAKEIGCTYDPLYQSCKLSKCIKFNDKNNPLPF